MRAVKLYAPGDLRLIEIEKPTPGPGEVLVQVKEVGVCASDVHYFNEGRIGDAVVKEPIIMGHEFAGVIAEVGSGVTNVKAGDRVAVEPGIPCHTCDVCLAGDHNLCRNIKFCGTPPYDGALRDFMTWPAQLVEPIPDSMSLGEAAMLEPLAVGVYAVEITGDVRGKTIGVLGAGAVGLSILQAAKAAGCGDAFVTEPLQKRRELAQKLGADNIFDANDPELVDIVKAATGGRGLDIVFEAAGENEAVVQATEMVRPGGIVVIGGIPREDSMTVTASTIRRKGLTIKMLRRSKDTLRRSIEMVKQGKADVASYITHRFPLEQVEDAFVTARDQKADSLRVLIQL